MSITDKDREIIEELVENKLKKLLSEPHKKKALL